MKQQITVTGNPFRRAVLVAFSIALLATLTSLSARAGEFQLTYTGVFTSAASFNGTEFANNTPYTAVAVFTDTSTNFAAPVGVPGFVAYSPLWATISFGGNTYSIETANQNPTAGITVAVFDQFTPFVPGHYAVGFIADILNDGAGIVGDFNSASPDYLATNLVPTVYGNYQGVGYGSGPNSTVVPWVLHNGAQSYDLVFGNFDEQYADTGLLNTAKLTAVPEPGTLALGSAGLLALQGLIRRRRRA